MNSHIKFLIFLVFAVGAAYMVNSCSAGAEMSNFRRDVETVVNGNWASPQAEVAVKKNILATAQKHKIPLTEDGVDVQVSRTNVAPYTVYILVTAQVTYEREILPFYNKTIKFTVQNTRPMRY
jgi:hypothetical protein